LKLIAILFALLSEADSAIKVGLNLIYEGEYEKAEEVFDKLVEMDSSSPLGYFFKAVLYETYMIDYDSYEKEKEFNRNLKLAMEKALKRIEKEEENGLYLYLVGACHFYRCVHSVFKGSVWKAIAPALRAKKYFEEAIEADSSMLDAYLGLAIYEWAVSKLFSFLPFNRNMDRVREKIELAASGKYSGFVSRVVWAWMLILDKKYSEAIDEIRELVENYKDNRLLLTALSTAYARSGRGKEAIQYYKKLLTLSERDPKAAFQRAVALLGIANEYEKKGMYQEALGVIKKIEKEAKERNLGRRHKEVLKLALKMKKKLYFLTGSSPKDIMR